MTAWPATVRTPVRTCVVGFASNEYVTVPGPEPLAPAVTDIQKTELDAVHAHVAGVVTPTVPVPAPAGADAVSGVTV